MQTVSTPRFEEGDLNDRFYNEWFDNRDRFNDGYNGVTWYSVSVVDDAGSSLYSG